MKKGGLRALVQGTIKVVLIIARLIACRTRSFPSGLKKRAEMLHHPCILGGPQTNGDKIRIGCLNPTFWGTHKWAEMIPQPYFLRNIHQRGQKQSIKKNKQKQKQKISHGVLDPSGGPVVCPHLGLTPGLFSCRGTALPLGYGPTLTYLCTGVVFIFGPIWFSSIIGSSLRN